MRQWIVATLTLVSLVACGDGGPSGSSQVRTTTTTAPASVELTVVAGESGEPVSGATVIVDGASHTTGPSGTISAGTVRVGATIDVLSENYFDRQTLYRGRNDARLSLWPRTTATGLTPEITQRIVYTATGEDAIPGEVALRRPPLG